MDTVTYRDITSFPAESQVLLTKDLPIKITLETEGGIDSYHAEIDVQNPHVGAIHGHGTTEDEAFDNIVDGIQTSYVRHMNYSQVELKGRCLARLNNLNRYMELK